jgi:hypothetical protein
LAAETPVTAADFSKDGAGWVFYGHKALDGGVAKLAVGDVGKYHGGLFQLSAPLRIPQDSAQSLRIRLKVGGFSDIAGSSDTGCSGRFYLSPLPLPKFVEPYAMSNGFIVCVNYAGANQPDTISLYSKVNGGAGFGDLLYQGTFDPSQFPVTMDLALTKDTYRVTFDKPVAPGSGGKSGYHKLPAAQWSGDLGFGGRIVNEDDQHESQIVLDSLTVSTTTPE